MQVYKHTQIGYIILSFMAVAAAVMIAIMLTSGAIALGAGVCVGIVLVLFLFGTLTVEIRDEKLIFWFGIGLVRKSIPLSEIEDCGISLFPWYYGWGIRYTPQGWLFNVSGFTAVRLMLKNAKRLQIGTDDADALCNVVTNAIRRTRMRYTSSVPIELLEHASPLAVCWGSLQARASYGRRALSS
jgi:hypothetical protein